VAKAAEHHLRERAMPFFAKVESVLSEREHAWTYDKNPSHYCPHAHSGMFSGGISGGLGTCSTPETNILIGKNYCRWRPLPRGLGEKALEVSS